MKTWEDIFDGVLRENLKALRQEADLDPADVAALAGVDVADYIALEDGRRVDPLASELDRIACALQVEPCDLTRGAPEPPLPRLRPRRWRRTRRWARARRRP
jgi:transcriptional regulator with XRE-family HTH domain